MTTKFFTNDDGNTLLTKLAGVFEHNPQIKKFDANITEQASDYNILIITEVMGEGINLHRANSVLNYDTPWNATKLMQRIGRFQHLPREINRLRNSTRRNPIPLPELLDKLIMDIKWTTMLLNNSPSPKSPLANNNHLSPS